MFPLTYTKRHEKRLSRTLTQRQNCVNSFPTGVRCLGQCMLFPMVRHTVSGYFTLLRDLNIHVFCCCFNLQLPRLSALGGNINSKIKKKDYTLALACQICRCDSRRDDGRCRDNGRRRSEGAVATDVAV